MAEEENEVPDFIEERDLLGNVRPKIRISSTPPVKEPELDVKYAGLGIRLLAYLIDAAMMVPIILFLEKLFFGMDGSGTPSQISLLRIIIWCNYYALTECSEKQATLGKRILGLKVINEKGGRLTYRQAYLRFGLMQLVSVLVFGLGILAIARDKKKQGWHDMIIGSYVIYSNPASNVKI